jgi:hypothetical protein
MECARGAVLIEALFAVGLLAAVAAGAAQVVTRAVRITYDARAGTGAVVLAAQKIDQLRSLTWSSSAAGVALSDVSTDLSTAPARVGGPGLTPSPPGTLAANVPPYVDYVNGMGEAVAGGALPPPTAVFVRRWSVQPLQGDPDTLVFEVFVYAAGRADDVRAQARVVSLATRLQ